VTFDQLDIVKGDDDILRADTREDRVQARLAAAPV
jgi:hypothetical protein